MKKEGTVFPFPLFVFPEKDTMSFLLPKTRKTSLLKK